MVQHREPRLSHQGTERSNTRLWWRRRSGSRSTYCVGQHASIGWSWGNSHDKSTNKFSNISWSTSHDESNNSVSELAME